jgi:hypothetical protein
MPDPKRDRKRAGPAPALARWLPTFDSDKYGLEILGPAVHASGVAERLSAIVLPDPKAAAFIILRLAAASGDDVRQAIGAAASLALGPRVCLSIEHQLLPSLDSTFLRLERVGLLLNIEDGSTPLSALTSDAIEAIRIDHDFAQRLSRSVRGAVLLEMLRNLAHEAGLASLGPSLQQGTEDFGLPIRFDYVAEGTIIDVLAKHRLR